MAIKTWSRGQETVCLFCLLFAYEREERELKNLKTKETHRLKSEQTYLLAVGGDLVISFLFANTPLHCFFLFKSNNQSFSLLVISGEQNTPTLQVLRTFLSSLSDESNCT